MIAVLIRYRHLIAIGTALIAFGGGWLYIKHLHGRIDTVTAQRDQYKAESEACQDNFKINKEISHAYNQQNINLRDQLAADKRLLSDSCVSIPTTARVDDPAPAGHVWKGQVSIADSLDYFAECGEIENRLRSLQDWIDAAR